MGDKIFVPLSIGYGRAVEGLGEIVSDISIKDFKKNIKDFKLVLFTGGADVSPVLYGEDASKLCDCSLKRDSIETIIYDIALANKVKMTGICRGAQLLNVLAGGRMMHHINNHEGGFHYVVTSLGRVIVTNSMHHQMIVPGNKTHVVGWSRYRLSDLYIGKDDMREVWNGPETEAIITPSTLSCGVQWHPEAMPEDSEGYIFYHSMVSDLLSMDVDRFTRKYTKGLSVNKGA